MLIFAVALSAFLGLAGSAYAQGMLSEVDQELPGLLGGVAAWGDYDQDGDQDLVLAGEMLGESGPQRIGRLYENAAGSLLFDSTASDELVGVYHGSVAWGDYDSDGYPDLAVVGWGADDEESLTLYRNASVETARRLSLDRLQDALQGVRYAELAWGDYDGDGDIDLVVAGMTPDGNSQTQIYRNSRGVLAIDETNSDQILGVHNGDLAWADYDNDGDLDLSISGDNVTYSGGGIVPEIRFYKNHPQGNLGLDLVLSAPLEDNVAGVRRGALAWGDYDGDGALDLAFSGRRWNSETSVSLYYNRPAGELSLDDTFRLPASRQLDGDLAFLDYDNDGDLDLAATGRSLYSEYMAYVFPNEDGRLETQSNEEQLEGLADGSVAWADYDRDGRADLLISGTDSAGQRRTILYQNQGGSNPNLQPEPPAVLYAPEVTSDYATFRWGAGSDGDGSNLTYSLRVGTEPGASDIFSGVSASGIGNAGFKTSKTLARPLPIDTYYWSVQSLDGAAATSEWSQEQILNVRRFVSSRQSLRALKEAAMDWGDSDGDGDLDLVLIGLDRSGNAQSLAYINNAGLLELDTASNAALNPLRNGDVAVADYDNDGLLDLLLTGEDTYESPGTYLYRRESSGLTPALEFPALSSSSVDWGDYDNDGDLDLVLMGQDATRVYWSGLFANDGGGGFVLVDSLVGLANGEVLWGDADGDGDQDLVATGSGATDPRQFLFFRNESGRLEQRETELPGLESSDLSWSDFDGDGDLDLASAGIGDFGALRTDIMVNSGAGDFDLLAEGLLPGIRGGDLVWGDFDNDRDQDLVIIGNDGEKPILRVYENSLGRSDAEQPMLLEPVDSTVVRFLDFSATALVDIDNDGDLDLVSAGSEGGVTAIPRTIVNDNLTGLFNPNQHPAVPQNTTSLDDGDEIQLSWSAVDDDGDDTPASLRYNVRVGTGPGHDDIFSGTTRWGFGNVGQRLSHQLHNLASGDYYWSVQSIDDGHARSAWSTPRQFTIDTVKPEVASILASRSDTVGVGQTVALVLEFTDQHTSLLPDVAVDVVAEWADTAIALTALQWNGRTWNSQLTVVEGFPSGSVGLSIAGASDAKGNRMDTRLAPDLFYVDADLPRMVAGDPSPDATDVAAAARTISIVFSEALDPVTVTADNFTLRRGTEVVDLLTDPVLDESASAVNLVPQGGLKPGSEYTVEISAAIRDRAGNRPTDATLWSFSTIVPSVVARSPASETSVAAEEIGRISVQFDAAIDESLLADESLAAVSVVREDQPQQLEGTPIFDANTHTLSFALAGGAAPGSRYRVVLNANLAGPLRAETAGDFNWEFETAVPALIAQSPRDDAPTSSGQFEAVFDLGIDQSLLGVETVHVLREGVEQTVTGVEFEAQTRTLRFEVEGGLKPGAFYEVRLAGILAGPLRVLSSGDYSWSFTTPVPQVVTTVPTADDREVSISDRTIEVAFDSPIDSDVLDESDNVRLLAGGVPVALTDPEYISSSRTLRFSAEDGLWAGTSYEVRIAAAAGGPRREEDYSWSFITPVPNLSTTTPRAGDESVDIASASITAIFDHPVNADVFDESENVRLVAGGVPVALTNPEYIAASRTLRFSAEDGLRAGTSYEVRIAAAVGGPRREGDYSWSFTTPVPNFSTTMPAVGDEVVDIELGSIVATFDHPVNADVFDESDNVRLLAGGVPVALTNPEYIAASRTLRFSAEEGLRAGTSYEVRIAAAAGGPHRKGDYSWSFTTPVPLLSTTVPAVGDEVVDIALSSIVATFDRPVNADVLEEPVSVRLLAEGVPVVVTGQDYNTDTRTFRFSTEDGLRAGTSYEVRIAAAAGGPGREGDYGWSFTTAVPQLATTTPTAGDESVDIASASIIAVFDHPVNADVLDESDNVRLLAGGVPLELTVPEYIADSRTLRFAPQAGLRAGTSYEIRIASAAGGPGREGDYSWEFSTAIPMLLAAEPSAGSGGVAATLREFSARFSAAIDADQLTADNFVLMQSGAPVELRPEDPSAREDNTYALAPADGWRVGTRYSVRIAAAVSGPLGPGVEIDIPFTTDIPAITAVTPARGDTSVIELGTDIRAVFDAQIDQDALLQTGGIQLYAGITPIEISLPAYDPATGTVAFQPLNGLRPGTAYQVRILPRVGGPLQQDVEAYNWSFSTRIPALVSLSPSPGAAVSAGPARLAVSFSGPVEPALINADHFGISYLGNRLPLPQEEFGFDRETYRVSFPTVALVSGSSYQVFVSARSGGPLAEVIGLQDSTWSFETRTPEIESLAPGVGEDGVSLTDPTIQISFTEPVARQLATDFRITTRALGSEDAVDERVALTGFGADDTGTAISFAPVGGLRPFAEYEVEVAREVLGNRAERGFSWIFRTAALLADSRQGGTISNAERSVTVYFPPNALPAGSNQVAIRRLELAAAGKPVSAFDPLQMTPIYELDAGVEMLSKPATLTLSYQDQRPQQEDLLPLAVFRYIDGLWLRVGGVEDPEAGSISTAVDVLGRFAVFEATALSGAEARVDQLDCQPRAFAPASGGLRGHTDISFALTGPADATIRIFNSAGRLVRVVTRQQSLAAGRATMAWDGRDEDGQVVPSGPYVVSVQVGDQRVDKVVAVVR